MKRAIPKRAKTPDEVERAIQLLGEGRLPTSAVADLPDTAAPGTVVFVEDALKDGETTGNGTGTLAYKSAAGWFRVCDDTAVSA